MKENLIVKEKILKNTKLFSVPITKEVQRGDKKGEEITETISSKLQFIDSATLMVSSSSNLVINFTERIHKINMDMIIANVKRVELPSQYTTSRRHPLKVP